MFSMEPVGMILPLTDYAVNGYPVNFIIGIRWELVELVKWLLKPDRPFGLQSARSSSQK